MNVSSIHTNGFSYNIYIDNDLLMDIGNRLKCLYSGKQIVVITDSNVEKLYYSMLYNSLFYSGYEINKITIQPGESSKSISTLERIYYELSAYNINRHSLIISLGGGVVGDLSGFAAATYLRGIPYVQIPTTLLSQVDSSIGGKVAVNLEFGKNLVGSFYHPIGVFIDTSLLTSLPDKYFIDGMAEVIKYGAIESRSLFDKLHKHKDRKSLMNDINNIISLCCDIKKHIVEIDEKDNGIRMLLNFGHTLGHAIERYYNYTKYTHGEAVAIGMSVFTKCSEQLGLTEQGTYHLLKKLLMQFSLPVKLPSMDTYQLLDAIKYDKKSADEHINIVLLNKIGDSYIYKSSINDLNKFICV